MLTEDRARISAARVTQTNTEDNPGLHNSDSVISLVAKSEYSSSVQHSLLLKSQRERNYTLTAVSLI